MIADNSVGHRRTSAVVTKKETRYRPANDLRNFTLVYQTFAAKNFSDKK